ncbi:MAG: hypothetical protein IH969_10240 [Candidatus Krumholzibacteriota bacterium]|nr:hypothetical protein [Candidatus Krumholzibacteriota bacterium]
MNDRIWEREQVYRRRFRVAIPLAALIIAALFFTSDRDFIDDMDTHIGWTGELRLMPGTAIGGCGFCSGLGM